MDGVFDMEVQHTAWMTFFEQCAVFDPNGQYYFFNGGEDEAADITEGRPWKTTVDGCRIPAGALDAERYRRPSFATGCVEYPTFNRVFTSFSKADTLSKCYKIFRFIY